MPQNSFRCSLFKTIQTKSVLHGWDRLPHHYKKEETMIWKSVYIIRRETIKTQNYIIENTKLERVRFHILYKMWYKLIRFYLNKA